MGLLVGAWASRLAAALGKTVLVWCWPGQEAPALQRKQGRVWAGPGLGAEPWQQLSCSLAAVVV